MPWWIHSYKMADLFPLMKREFVFYCGLIHFCALRLELIISLLDKVLSPCVLFWLCSALWSLRYTEGSTCMQLCHTHTQERKRKKYDESVCHTINHVELICLRQNVDWYIWLTLSCLPHISLLTDCWKIGFKLTVLMFWVSCLTVEHLQSYLQFNCGAPTKLPAV